MHLLTLLPFLIVTQQAAVSVSPDAAPCVACRADLPSMRERYSASDWQALTDGKILTSEAQAPQADGSIQSNVESTAIIGFPADQVWTVVADFEARPRFIPGTKAVHIVRTEGNRLWITEHLRFFLINISFQVINTLDPEHGLASWTLDKSADHDIADTTGSWQIAPLPPGQSTLVRYRAWVDSGRPVPGFIEDFVTKRSLPKVVGGLRSEVQRRFGP